MAIWADYYISAVRYNPAHTHIDKVLVHNDSGINTIGSGTECTRNKIVEILTYKSVVTIYRGSDNLWHRGQEVHPVPINGVMYIRTNPNKKEVDNLENLLEF